MKKTKFLNIFVLISIIYSGLACSPSKILPRKGNTYKSQSKSSKNKNNQAQDWFYHQTDKQVIEINGEKNIPPSLSLID